MGTVFSFDIRDPGEWSAAISEAVAGLHAVDATYSTYRDDSVISRLGRGELTLQQCPAQVGEVFDFCAQISRDSNGYFSIEPAGRLDPSGFVKGWAIEQAGAVLAAHGARHHAVNGGGDVQLAGEAAPGHPWHVGIADPRRPGKVLAVVAATDGAVATSGTAERGAHVVDPFTSRPAVGLVSITVVGRHLTLVDAYATAALAMGERSREWLEGLNGYEALAVRPDGSSWQTAGFSAWAAPPAAG